MREATGMVWWVNRLRCMSVAEVGYRIQQAAAKGVAKRMPSRATPPLPRARSFARSLDIEGAPPLSQHEREVLLADADSICAGHVVLFANRRFDVGMPPVWNRDPDSGVLGPAIYAGDIDIRNRELVGDIKHVWELNRHLHLVRLAQAWSVTRDVAWLHALHQQLRSWLDQCPARTGPNWTSSLELGIRLINWGLVWELIGGEASGLFAGDDGQRLRADWLDSIHAHCSSIARHLSRHSSANNHLIGELAGLYVGASIWPCWKSSNDWLEQARSELEHEAQAQFSRDGVNREQAFAYHIFSSEFLFVAGLVGQACNHPFSRAYWTSLQRSLRFLRSVRDVGGHVPMVGDADDGIVFRLDEAGSDRTAQLLALGDAVLRPPEPPYLQQQHAPQQAPRHAGVRWLLHALPGKLPECDPHESDTGWAFPDGGYLLFGSHFGEADEIKGMVDCGPLGYLGIAAHGHADALSLSLSIGGEECLVDPGTYSYGQERKWRDYFRGTSAHNTVRIDGADQSLSGGPFMWLKKANAQIERMPQSPHEFDFRGSHDGYERLADPVRHMRSVRFDAASATLVVRDEIAAKKHHQVELFWHFAPGLNVRLNSSGLHVRGKRFALQMQAQGADLSLELVHGNENPPLGWVSRSYESKQACDVLKISTVSSAVPVECRFTITFF
ncbi:alginate lyase family protein [Herbaspirillum sp. SJZ107]|uniref:heparinase II/III family protein n=1 Tax=Herbaspirillum sp. SJZ107 TaxID=2572881 RepID=UPI001170C1BB|nr:alginate lyase family protein [Herbaspirillum sp. SJZ107]TQK10538.1 heparinase II/III-like protein [Herbaspirillum sp. SJZ107]